MMYNIYYIYKHFSKKISQNVENDCFLFFEYLIYFLYIYIYKDKTMTIFVQSTVINYSIIKTHHYPIFQTLRIFLIGK